MNDRLENETKYKIVESYLMYLKMLKCNDWEKTSRAKQLSLLHFFGI